MDLLSLRVRCPPPGRTQTTRYCPLLFTQTAHKMCWSRGLWSFSLLFCSLEFQCLGSERDSTPKSTLLWEYCDQKTNKKTQPPPPPKRHVRCWCISSMGNKVSFPHSWNSTPYTIRCRIHIPPASLWLLRKMGNYFPCPKGVQEDSWVEILSVYWTCHLELSFFLC